MYSKNIILIRFFMNDKIIGWVVVWALSIAWVTISVTDEDIAEQYKENTWRELSVSQEDLVTYDEIILQYKEFKTDIQDFSNSIDCVNYDYEFSSSCESVEAVLWDYIVSVEKSLSCFNRINNNSDLQESDLNFCVDAMNEEKVITKDFYIKTEWFCNMDCNNELENSEYNLATFQAYLNNIK